MNGRTPIKTPKNCKIYFLFFAKPAIAAVFQNLERLPKERVDLEQNTEKLEIFSLS
jgi:hypothetical protein